MTVRKSFSQEFECDRTLEALRLSEPEASYYKRGPLQGTSHPWEIRRNPKIGEEVSEAFNGDFYPRGKIVRVTATKAITDRKHVFRKNGQGIWKTQGSCFSMVHGVHSRLNPEF